MNNHEQSRERSDDAYKTRRVNEWHVGFRIVAPVILFLALVLGNAQWVQSGLDMAAAEPSAQPQRTAQGAEYFPAQYTNQAQTLEADSPTF